jgi:hypothetical protein
MSELPVRSRSSALVEAPDSIGLLYFGRAAAHPSGVTALVFGLCLGAWIGGIAGTALGLLGGLVVVAVAAGSPGVRRLIDIHLAERERSRRALERERRLSIAGPLRRAEFGELSALVDEIERAHADRIERFELQELLDDYVELAVHHQRLIEAVQRADRAPLWQAATARASADLTPASKQRQEILARRLQHRDQCRTRATQRAEELDAIAEFIHLVSEITSCPCLDPGAHQELERRMWELDAQQTALRQLSAA